ncbi:MAG: asparaginase domain-containing protein [Lachnospiraceae bacterium]|nr:asparaginase domain-containing protein [Lachnospiraceae bacterium]
MNILVILTGGTIGSKAADGYIKPAEEQSPQLISLYREYEMRAGLAFKDNFSSVAALNILSENMDGAHLYVLIRTIKENLAAYDGIIVAHGTDTLQYTAAGLAEVFTDIDKPVVLVSSNYVLDDARANGFANFAAAVTFIRNRLGCGVFVSYQNNITRTRCPGKDTIKETIDDTAPVYIHRGNALLPHNVYSDALYSLYDGWHCKILPEQSGDFVRFERYMLAEETNTAPAEDTQKADGKSQSPITDFSITSGVLVLPALPGMCFPQLTPNIKAVLLVAFHSGTLPTGSEGFRSFVLNAHALKIPVYVTGVQNQAGGTSTPYESTACYEELHLKVLPEMSPAAAYIKLWGTKKI